MKAIDLKKVYAQVSRWALPFLVVAFLISLVKCEGRGRQIIDLSRNLDSVAMQVKYVENEKGQVVAQNKQLEAASAEHLKQLTDSIFALKKKDAKNIKTVQEYARIIQKYEKKEIFIPFDPVDTPAAVVAADQPLPEIAQDTNFLRVPKKFGYTDTSGQLAFKGVILRTGLRVDSIGIINTIHYRTLINKTGFLNLGRSSTVEVLNSNPHMATQGVISIAIPHRVGWWHRWGKPLAAAVLAGVAVDYLKR
jgi:hypothetical protein